MCVSDAIRLAARHDLDLLISGLSSLAQDLADPYRISAETLETALFGAHPIGFAMLCAASAPADSPLTGTTPPTGPHDRSVTGVVLAQPMISTARGGAVTYVSDLWVATHARGGGLGRRLLAATAREARTRWQVQALRLTVYAENSAAQAFYAGSGFEIHDRERAATLAGPGLERLMANA